MIRVDFDHKKIFITMVFYGPPGCGKKTWLQTMHRFAANPGRLNEIDNTSEKSLSFLLDYWPGQNIEGFSHIFEFQTCCQNLDFESLDAIVFMADSTPGCEKSNLEYLDALKEQVSAKGLKLTAGKLECQKIASGKKSGQQILSVSKIPCVLAFNKRDLNNCIPLEEMKKDLKLDEISSFETVGSEGFGTFGIFKDMHNRIIDGIHRRKSLVEIVNEKKSAP